MNRINLLGISINAAAIVIVVVSVVAALVMYREPKPAEEITPEVTEAVNAPTSTERANALPFVATVAPSATQTATRTITPTASLTPTVTRPAACVALPFVPGATAAVTGTPFPIAYFYDLDPAARPQDKAQVVVFRCRGTWDEFLLVAAPGFLNRIPLQAGDVIYKAVLPASQSQTASPSATPAPSRTVTRTATP